MTTLWVSFLLVLITAFQNGEFRNPKPFPGNSIFCSAPGNVTLIKKRSKKVLKDPESIKAYFTNKFFNCKLWKLAYF
jgi:hypothetical protein